jgi:hypothetical protein
LFEFTVAATGNFEVRFATAPHDNRASNTPLTIRSADGEKNVYEHAKTKQLYQVPKGELTPEFFVQVQAQLSVLVGEPKPRAASAPAFGAAPESASTPAPSA